MKTISKLALLALPLGMLTACQDYDPLGGEEGMKELLSNRHLQETLNEYTVNFEERFGKIDTNHDWGFRMIIPDEISTRAQVANKNEWESVYHMQVPGWPDIWYEYNPNGDAILHTGWNDDRQTGTDYANHNGESGVGSYSDSRGLVPGGDVTYEEIQYVSWWFRTHRYPSSLNVHWSDFYIQDISADNDRLDDGSVITAESFAEYEVDNNGIVGGWKRSRWQECATYSMDQLKVKTLETYSDDINDYDHIYNYNSGQSNHLATATSLSMAKDYQFDDNITSQATKRLIAFYQTSGTEDWAAHYAQDEMWRDNYVDKQIWVMVHLHFVGPSGRIYDGYYIGFDYAFQSVNAGKYQIRKPDGYYSNWIVKVSPGVPLQDDQNKAFSRRIMCEDLGNTWDLDFDDVVFDATLNMSATDYANFTSGNVDISITLMAAGGTMPIWVGIDPRSVSAQKKTDYEIHKLFNANESTPVNVANGVDAPVANYHITLNVPSGKKETLFDLIPIYIYNNRKVNGEDVGYVELPKSVVENYNKDSYMTSETSKAPQKFAVPTSVLWLKETHQIESGYPKFKEWVTDNNSNYAESGTTPWFTTGKQPEHLCGMAAETPYVNSPTPGTTSDSGLAGTTSNTPYGLKYDVIPFVNNRSWGCLEVWKNGSKVICTDDGNNVQLEFKNNEKAQLHAVAKNGAVFMGWDDGNSGLGTFNSDIEEDPNHRGDNTWKLIPVDRMQYVMAYFKGAFTVTMATGGDAAASNARITDATSEGNGTVDRDNNKYYSANLSFTCDNISGKTFIGWYICDEIKSDGTMVNAEYLVGLGQNATWKVLRSGILVPYFLPEAQANYVFTIEQPEGGTIEVEGNSRVNINGNTVTCPYGINITYKLTTLNPGYEWVSFNTGSKNQHYNSLTIVPGCLPDNKLSANLNKIYSATVLCQGSGTVSGAALNQPKNYSKNYPLSLSATPNSGSTFDGWYVNDVKVSTELSTTILITDYNMQIVAKFQ